MNIYSGPTRRVLRRSNDANGFRVEGLVDHLESRTVYCKQRIQLQQTATNNLADFGLEWLGVDENGMNYNVGDPIPFSQKHVFEDRFLLNNTFVNMKFKPDQAYNYLPVENRTIARLAPLLCSEKRLNNITKLPIVTDDGVHNVKGIVTVQHGAYGRFYFGYTYALNGNVADGLVGEHSPYFLPNPDQAVAGGNVLQPSVFGFLPLAMPSGQRLRHYPKQYRLGEKAWYRVTWGGEPHVKEYGEPCGELEWFYNEEEDVYELDPFYIDVPWPIDNPTKFKRVRTPKLQTFRSNEWNPYNYWFTEHIDGIHEEGRTSLPAAAEIEVAVLGGAYVDTTQNSKDFVKISLGAFAVALNPAAANPANNGAPFGFGDNVGPFEPLKELFWFVPAFRIVKGNNISSIPRPRRFDEDRDAVLGQTWRANNDMQWPYRTVLANTPAAERINAAALNRAELDGLQMPFWADYEETKHRVQYIEDSRFPGQGILTEDPIWEYVHVASYVDMRTEAQILAGHAVLYGLKFRTDAEIGDDHISQLINDFKDMVVDTRLIGNAFNAHGAKALYLLLQRNPYNEGNQFHMYRLQVDECNRYYFAGANGNYDNGLPAVANASWDDRVANWDDNRTVQIGQEATRGGYYHRTNLSVFRGTASAVTHQDINQPFGDRGAYVIQDILGVGQIEQNWFGVNQYTEWAPANGARLAVPFPTIVQSATFYEANADNQAKLYMPRKKTIVNTIALAKTRTVTCVEPLIGYGSGAAELHCIRPLNFARHGQNWPLIVQDYEYTMSRNLDFMFTRGFIKSEYTNLIVTPEAPIVFTSISEKHHGVYQADKEVTTISEVSPTINVHKTTYTPGSTASIEFETREGNFEYLFMFIEYNHELGNQIGPYRDSIITSLQLKVRGRENLFVRELAGDELERLSRENCHDLCDWRGLHESGQGLLLRLADVGLTEEKPFPSRGRIQLEVTLLTEDAPAAEIWPENMGTNDALLASRTFYVAVIRENQLLKGNFEQMQFVFLNEE